MTTTIYHGDCLNVLRSMPAESVDCVVTSPPYYGLRDYGSEGQIGLEESPAQFVEKLVEVFREVRRVLKADGTIWVNMGDSYAGSGRGLGDVKTNNKGNPAARHIHSNMVHARAIGRSWVKPPEQYKQKDLMGIPWRLAFALQEDGWYLRQDIIWHKPNPMPESVTDRCTKAHEYIFLLSKSRSYRFDAAAIAEAATHEKSGNTARKDGEDRGCPTESTSNVCSSVPWEGDMRNKRSVWTVSPEPFDGAHFATFPPKLIEPCILAGCPDGGIVLDPFFGAGTTGLVADRLRRNCIGIELNRDYVAMAEKRLREDFGMFGQITINEECTA